MPDLLYDSLQQVKRLPLQQQRAQLALLEQQKKSAQSIQWGVTGATFILLSAILPLYDLNWCFPALSASVGSLCWVLAWRKNR